MDTNKMVFVIELECDPEHHAAAIDEMTRALGNAGIPDTCKNARLHVAIKGTADKVLDLFKENY